MIDMPYTSAYIKRGKWYIGWVEEVPGVNTQGKTLKELRNNLKEALVLVLEASKEEIKKEHPRGRIMREPLLLNV